jgi:hypothetical protein
VAHHNSSNAEIRGVSAAADDNILRAVDLLFNAGVSLRAQKDVPESKAAAMFRARLLVNAAGLRLAIVSDTLSTSPALDPALQRAIEALRTLFGFPARGSDDIIVDSADVVGRLYASVLLEDSSRELQSVLVDIGSKRNAAMQVLVAGYAEYAATTPGDVASDERWRKVQSPKPPGSGWPGG